MFLQSSPGLRTGWLPADFSPVLVHRLRLVHLAAPCLPVLHPLPHAQVDASRYLRLPEKFTYTYSVNKLCSVYTLIIGSREDAVFPMPLHCGSLVPAVSELPTSVA